MKKIRSSLRDDEELDAGTLEFWRLLSLNPAFHKILEYLDSQKGEYSEHKPPSVHQHIQQERNGGMKAWIKLTSLLLNPPQPDFNSVTEKQPRRSQRHIEE